MRFNRHVLAAALIVTLTSTSTNAAQYVSFPNPCYDLPARRTTYDGLQSHDDGWELIAFHDLPGSPNVVESNEHHNDDLSSLESLDFVFEFFDKAYTEVFINNNGNLSFDGPYSHYDPAGFPIQGFDMIAPVRTRRIAKGVT